MNRVLCVVLSAFSFLEGNAQQVPFYNHNVVNPFVFNPAMAGKSGYINAYLARNQRYTGFNGGAVNNVLTIDGPFLQDKGGFGLSVVHQTQGIQTQVGAGFTYAYQVKINEDNDLRFGATFGVLDNRIDLAGINVSQANDPYLTGLRPNAVSFNMNAGLSYRWKDLRVGVAVPQVVGNKVNFSEQNTRGYYRLARHIMGSAQYDIQLIEKQSLILTPQAIVRYVPGAPLQYDLTAHVDQPNLGWASVTYKSNYAIQFNLGVHLMRQLHVGYSYEYLIGSINNYSSGFSQEFLIGYTFKSGKTEIIRVTEKVEKIREVLKENPTNEELVRKNKELEEELKRNIEEQERLRVEKEQLEAEKRQTEEMLRLKAEQDKQKPKEVQPDTPKEDINEAYRFVELDSTDAPDGIYVIGGVFSSRRNAERSLSQNIEDYPDVYLVVNKKNGFFYVVILYTKDEDQAKKEYNRFKKKTGLKAWMLNYKLE
jgi:type IX secretion system PorP/SprF family membrane protein